jgi:hypothetical protein
MIYLIIGRREQGKTTLALHMARKMPSRVIFDPRNTIRHGVKVRSSDEYKAGIEALKSGEISELVYTPRGNSQAGFEVFATGITGWVEEYYERPLAVLVDEIAFADLDSESFQWIARCCSREHLHILLTCHRPNDVDTSVRAISDHWLLFPCRQEHDLEVIRKRCNMDVAEEVQRLEPRQFVHWDDTKGEYQIVRRAAAWHVPLRDAEQPGQPAPTVTDGLGGETPARKKALAEAIKLPI